MRRAGGLLALALLALSAGCQDDGESPAQPPAPEEDEAETEASEPGGLRVGVVLPPRDAAPVDELSGVAAVEALAGAHGEVDDVRAVVPDGSEYVGDVAEVLAGQRDLVCVLGDQAVDAIEPLVDLFAGTDWCVAPADAGATWPEGVEAVDVAVEELGHLAGAALASLHGEDDDAGSLALLAAERTQRSSFRAGLRAATDGVPVRQVTGGADQLAQVLADAEDLVGVLVDAGPDQAELAERAAGRAPLLATDGLAGEGAPSPALTWAVRWDAVVERALTQRREDEPPARLGVASDALEASLSPEAPGRVADAVEAARAGLESGARDPLGAAGDEPGSDRPTPSEGLTAVVP